MPLRLYPPVPPVLEDYRNVKVVTVPNQSMTLKDIIARFMRKESLPIEKEGIYAENLGDIEKISREDVTVRHERAADLREKINKTRARAKEKAEADAKGKGESPSVPPTPPVQTPTADPSKPPHHVPGL